MRFAISSGYLGPNSFTGNLLSGRHGPPGRDRRLDVLVGDVDVRDHPDLARDHARPDAMSSSRSAISRGSSPSVRCRRRPCSFQHPRDPGCRARSRPRPPQAGGPARGPRARASALLERHQAGGRDDPGLPPGPAEQDLDPAALPHLLGRAAHERADRRAESLRDAEHQRVDLGRVLGHVHAGSGARVEDPRAVQVDRDAGLLGNLADRPKSSTSITVPPRARSCSPGRRGRRSRRRRARPARAPHGPDRTIRPRRSPWTVLYAIPDSTAALITSVEATCDSGSATTRCPGPENCSRSAIWLAIVPLGTYSAASLPVTSAARSWRRLTVGSSPNQSSPTSASAIARRIATEGLVTVSEQVDPVGLHGRPV